jgi:hypothetical protein
MNAMKKIFLLSLLSVFLLSTFSQNYEVKPEILTQIQIVKSADLDDDDLGQELLPGGLWWWHLYKWVTYEIHQWGFVVRCYGFGPLLCMQFNLRGLINDLPEETSERTVQELISESGERALKGEYRGSSSKKIVPMDGKFYIFFQINWDYDPKNIRNGNAEIIISKIANFGLK